MDDESPVAGERLGEVLADVEGMADDHREAGRETVVVPPTDAGVLDGTPFGLEVVTPRDRFDALEAVVDVATLDTSHVYRTEADDVRLLIVLLEGTLPPTDAAAEPDADTATGDAALSVFVPAVLPLPADALAARAREAGAMYTHVRPPADDARVTFTHQDPELFF